MKTWLVVILISLLSACSKAPETGPVEVKWDRDACERCRMVLSDRNFAAEVRGGERKEIFKFDELGCALHWLEKQTWKNDLKVEVWVKDFQTQQWLDARKAFYLPNQTTPMDYGFAATSKSGENTVDFEVAKKAILAKTNRHSHHSH